MTDTSLTNEEVNKLLDQALNNGIDRAITVVVRIGEEYFDSPLSTNAIISIVIDRLKEIKK